MAQGQRAGLITPRSLDRNEFPVLFIKQSNDIVRLSDAINRVGMDSLKYVKYSMQVVYNVTK